MFSTRLHVTAVGSDEDAVEAITPPVAAATNATASKGRKRRARLRDMKITPSVERFDESLPGAERTIFGL